MAGWDAILPLLVYIQAHLDDDLSLATLSRRTGLSRSYLHRTFKTVTGETLRHHVERLRLEHSAFRLAIQDGSLLDIALDCGFRNHETFTRAFRRHFGVPPQAYRVQARRTLPPADPGIAPTGDAPLAFELSSTRVVRFRDLHLAFIRHLGPYESVPQELFDRLAQWGLRQSIPGPWVWMGIGHDAPGTTSSERLRFDAALVVPGPFAVAGQVGHQILAGGDFAVTRHAGPLATLPQAYATLFPRLLALKRYRLIGLPAVEIYHTVRPTLGHAVQHTDICLPVTRREDVR